MTTRGKITAKDLFTEAERLLARTSGGLSLLERLVRDAELREDMANLLKELTADAKRPGNPPAITGSRS
jgi:hypothetical protein